ncbi:MAG TPA: hypothetical protein VNA25_14575, partial [Phycisphaerae bacterium]|nr:hypothetical protein [Phycisphaerae bacterium]
MNENDKPKDRADQILKEKQRSFEWLETNFFGEWEQAWKNYKCKRDPEKDLDGKEDPELTAVGMPDTWGYARRTVARGTAQAPNLRYHAKDAEVSELISRTLMYNWDRGKAQRIQKKHLLQAVLFGWSVKAWHWARDERIRRKRVDIANLQPGDLEDIINTYNLNILRDPRVAESGMIDRILSSLLAKHGRGNLLPVRYLAKSYEGPKSDFLLVGDCFPQPNFTSLQDSAWFIVERRRRLPWLKALAEAYPQFSKPLDELVKKHPDGTQPPSFNDDHQNLRNRLQSVIDRRDETSRSWEDEHAPEWTITEEHRPGENPTLRYVAEDIYLGELEYPYEL